jgi:ATP-binding cassette subfamily C protein/competence factor transporting protein
MYKELVSDYLNENKGIITAFILITLLTFPIESIAIPELYGRLYNTVSGGKRSDELLRRVGKIIMIIIGVWLFIQVFYYIKNWLLGKILPTYLEFTRRVLFTRIIENYENNYQDIKISKNINRLFNLTRDMKDVFFYVATCLIPLALTIGIVNIYLYILDWKIGLIATISIGIMVVVSYFFSMKIIEISAIREGKFLDMSERIHDSFENLMNIYLNNEKNKELEKTQSVQTEHTDYYNKQLELINNMQISTCVMSVVAFALIIGIAYYNFSKGIFTSQRFITVSLIIIYFLGFLININSWTPEQLMNLGIVKNSDGFLRDILKEKKNKYVKNPKLNGDIVIDNITYGYGDNDPIFSGFSLRIKKNERVAILGQSGSGKSTLMKLLLGLLPLKGGNIFVNDIPIQNIEPDVLRSHINYINQRTQLLNGTVLENMKYGNTIDDKKLVGIVKKYGLDANFQSLEQGLRSDVGNQGKSMSGGMQKIIMNVRGILKKGNVVVFDEPLAGLDAITRVKMIKMIDDMTKNKTLIVITHDKEILGIMNKTINLHDMKKKKVEMVPVQAPSIMENFF